MKCAHKRQKIETVIKTMKKKKYGKYKNNQFGQKQSEVPGSLGKTRDHPGNSGFLLLTAGTNLPCRNYTA